MKFILLLSLSSYLLLAALPPKVQKEKDLRVMQSFVKKYPKVSSTLMSIDTYSQEIHYGKGCISKFGRSFSFHLPGWVGPASELEFKESNCPID